MGSLSFPSYSKRHKPKSTHKSTSPRWPKIPLDHRHCHEEIFSTSNHDLINSTDYHRCGCYLGKRPKLEPPRRPHHTHTHKTSWQCGDLCKDLSQLPARQVGTQISSRIVGAFTDSRASMGEFIHGPYRKLAQFRGRQIFMVVLDWFS